MTAVVEGEVAHGIIAGRREGEGGGVVEVGSVRTVGYAEDLTLMVLDEVHIGGARDRRSLRIFIW